ncbi:sialidase family protein [Longispora urticae]
MGRGTRLVAAVAVAALVAGLVVADDGRRTKETSFLQLARYKASRVAAWDTAHVYTTFLACRDGRCAFTLAATGDGGRTWARRPLPLDEVSDDRPSLRGMYFRLSVLAPDVLRLWSPEWAPGPAWWSTDAGATWRSVPAALPVVRSVPPGWVPLGIRVDDEPEGEHRLPVGDPATGSAALLAVPARSGDLLSPDAPVDRGIWLSVGGQESGLRVSPDRGATFSKVVPPWPDGRDVTFPQMTVARDGTVYLAASQMSKAVLLLARSSDGGVTWASIAPTGQGMVSLVRCVAVLPDGGLVVASGDFATAERFHVSQDGGRTFTVLPAKGFPRYASGFVPLPGGGYVTRNLIGEVDVDTLAVSDDLRTWRVLRPPTR